MEMIIDLTRNIRQIPSHYSISRYIDKLIIAAPVKPAHLSVKDFPNS